MTTESTKLIPAYDSTLIGAVVGKEGDEKFAYSLRKLVRFFMMENSCTASEARELLMDQIVGPLHGEICFINDELLDPISDEEKPVIIVPPSFGKQG